MTKLFTLVALTLSLLSRAQPYKSIFNNPGPRWITGMMLVDNVWHDTVFVEKDTIVEGLAWKKLGASSASLFHPALMREDTVSGKVWYKKITGDTSTVLAFDFSLVKGDSFDIGNVWGDYPAAGKVVDTVYAENGRKIIEFAAMIDQLIPEKIRFIEGIGSNMGILYKQPHTIPGLGHYLLCAYHNQSKVFSNKQFSGQCRLATSIREPGFSALVRIYPSPAHHFLIVENKSPERLRNIEILNSMGQTVQSGPFKPVVDISPLPPGMFYLRLCTVGGKLLTRAFIKNR